MARGDYETRHAGDLLPSQRRAMIDVVRCRTPALGGSVFRCDDCGALDYAYHSCRNRHCPKCQDEREQEWLTAVRARLLPTDHYLLTFTLPAALRAIAARHQHVVYSALLHAAAAAVQTLARDRRWIGGTRGMVSVLHTWTRTLEYHPHAHLIVTAGGLAADGPSTPFCIASCSTSYQRTSLKSAIPACSVRPPDRGWRPRAAFCKRTPRPLPPPRPPPTDSRWVSRPPHQPIRRRNTRHQP